MFSVNSTLLAPVSIHLIIISLINIGMVFECISIMLWYHLYRQRWTSKMGE